MNQSLPPESLPKWKRLTFNLISILLGLLFSLTVAEAILRYQRQLIAHSDHIEAGMVRYDRQLGWRLTPGWQGAHHHHDFDTRYKINNLGFRGETAQQGNQKERIKQFAVVGDSFTFGTGVDLSDTFIQQLNILGGADRVFINFGVPGYSTDQEYLLLDRYIRPHKPNHVILIVYLANDLFDNELAFPMQAENGKPFFSLDTNQQLTKHNSPVPMQKKPAAASKNTLQYIVLGEQVNNFSFLEKTVGKLEIFRRLGLFQYQPEISEFFFEQRFDDTLRLFYAMVSGINEICTKNKAELSLVLLPGRSVVSRPGSVSAQYQTYLAQQITHHFKKQTDIQLIDLLGPLTMAYKGNKAPLYFPNEGHLTPAGHKIAASEIYKSILQK